MSLTSAIASPIHCQASCSHTPGAPENDRQAGATACGTRTYAGNGVTRIDSPKKASHFLRRMANWICRCFHSGSYAVIREPKNSTSLFVRPLPNHDDWWEVVLASAVMQSVDEWVEISMTSGDATSVQDRDTASSSPGASLMEELLSEAEGKPLRSYDHCKDLVGMFLNTLSKSQAELAGKSSRKSVVNETRFSDQRRLVEDDKRSLEKQRGTRRDALEEVGGKEFEKRCRQNFQAITENAQGSSKSPESSIAKRYIRAYETTCKAFLTSEQILSLNDVLGPLSAYQPRLKSIA